MNEGNYVVEMRVGKGSSCWSVGRIVCYAADIRVGRGSNIGSMDGELSYAADVRVGKGLCSWDESRILAL